MLKNKFCIIPNKTLIHDDSITMIQSYIYKNNGNENNKNKNIKKLKERFYNKDFKYQNTSKLNDVSQINKNYFISKKILSKYSSTRIVNIGLLNINNKIKSVTLLQYIMKLLYLIIQKNI